ncbi:MAG: hypothetical protein KKF44_03240 [Nanoarchaeota archaeon]|nr:hypothetical protein [Nanoarchaeota archaeon]
MGLFNKSTKNKQQNKPVPQPFSAKSGSLPLPLPLHDSKDPIDVHTAPSGLPPPPPLEKMAMSPQNPSPSSPPHSPSIPSPTKYEFAGAPRIDPPSNMPSNIIGAKPISPPIQPHPSAPPLQRPMNHSDMQNRTPGFDNPMSIGHPYEPFKPKPFGETAKPAPSELPEFPNNPSTHEYGHSIPQPEPTENMIGTSHKSDGIQIPEPPPNLRSEISPLELEKLESKYLSKHPEVRDVEESFSYSRHQKPIKPIFVRTDEYRMMLNNFIDIKDTVTESEEIIFRLENLKKNMDMEYLEYKKGLEDMQRKFIYIDKTLFND